MKTVLITGASGLIGTRLTLLLQQKGYHVIHLSRRVSKKSEVETYLWDVHKQTIDERAVKAADYIIHLAGMGIADKRWTKERKKEIIDSRTESIHLLFKTIQQTNTSLKGFISSSAAGIYGAITTEKIYSENDPPAADFLGITCKRWEEAADTISKLNVRVVKIRTGVVLSEKGGALQRMTKPIQFFVGSPLGDGKQYVPWIHLDDICNIYLKAIEDETMQGAYNAVAPEHVTNKELTHAIAHALHRPLVMPNVPAFLLKILFGEMSVIVLKGSRISCKKLEEGGFVFKYNRLHDALKNLRPV